MLLLNFLNKIFKMDPNLHLRRELLNKVKNTIGFTPPICKLSLMAGQLRIDIVKLDDIFSSRDPDYDNVKCTYKTHINVSVADYLELKFDESTRECVQTLL